MHLSRWVPIRNSGGRRRGPICQKNKSLSLTLPVLRAGNQQNTAQEKRTSSYVHALIVRYLAERNRSHVMSCFKFFLLSQKLPQLRIGLAQTIERVSQHVDVLDCCCREPLKTFSFTAHAPWHAGRNREVTNNYHYTRHSSFGRDYSDNYLHH